MSDRILSSSTIRPAEPSEAAALSDLARRSKAHWGYDEGFLAALEPLLTFTPQDFELGTIWVLELEGELLGTCRVVGSPPEGELSDLWLDPDVIGRGYGRQLLSHVVEAASDDGFETLLVESDPNAEGFYVAMGARHVGHRRSGVGRWLPLLRIDVAPA